jgi:hypothetical protein
MIHNTHFAQYIPPTLWHYATATMTQVAGQVAGTIAMNRAAEDQTSVITIPIMVPANSVALQGAKLASIEVDYENLTAEVTSFTWTLNKVTRGIDTAVAVVSAVTKTDAIAAADSHSVDQHKQVITITTPEWVSSNTYYLLQISIVAGAGGGVNQFYAAFANFTFKA